MKFKPKYDPTFLPAIIYLNQILKKGKVPFAIVVENNNYNYGYHFNITGDNQQSFFAVERLLKSLLWIVGGNRVYLAGPTNIIDNIKQIYKKSAKRKFDKHFMENVYKTTFEIIEVSFDNLPENKKLTIPFGGHTDGHRIGFDAGGSDIKISAVSNGKVRYSNEIIWHPKLNSDPSYHYQFITSALKEASKYLPCIDAIGISSAGIYIDNQVRAASLFLQVSPEDFKDKIENIYLDIVKQMGNIPLAVANDGDVAALAGALELNDHSVLGLAFGTSEAAGYINDSGCLNGWLNELAFVPVDFFETAAIDEWSDDLGCGVKYFSQDAVIKLALNAGLDLSNYFSPAEKLKYVQELASKNDPVALDIFSDIGIYLGYTIPFYALFYNIKHLLLLGRVISGIGGEIIVKKAKEVLKEEFGEYSNINIVIPDEKNRKVGQAIAAASLVKI